MSLFLLFSCSKSNSSESGRQLTLTFLSNDIDEGDEVTFNVTLDNKPIDADIYVDGTKTTGSTHRFSKMGINEVYAQKQD